MARGRAVVDRDFAYFRVSYDILRSPRKRSSPCVSTTVVVLKQPSQSTHTSREAETFRRRFRLPYISPRTYSPFWPTAEAVSLDYAKVQNLIPHDYIPSCTVYTVVQQYLYVCVFFPSILDIKFVGRTSRVTQEEGHTGFLIHLPSAVRALIFVARRIQPFLSLVDREVEFCVLTN